jgi:hypothetical protein
MFHYQSLSMLCGSCGCLGYYALLTMRDRSVKGTLLMLRNVPGVFGM